MVKFPCVSSRNTVYFFVVIRRVIRKFCTFSLFASRYSNCCLISSTVLCLRSSNHGDSFFAHSLHRFPSSSLRFPSNPIFSPQISQYFLSNNPILFLPSLTYLSASYSSPALFTHLKVR